MYKMKFYKNGYRLRSCSSKTTSKTGSSLQC